MILKGKKILVVGYGVSGEALVRFLLEEKAIVSLNDQVEKALPAAWAKLVKAHWGNLTAETVAGQDLIVISPGVPTRHPALETARKKKTTILGEMGLACLYLKAPLIAVTGTNGKSTVATLLYELLKKEGFRTDLAGNIGKPLIEVVREGKKLDWVVVEVSSYQLETMATFRPRISLILNITEDHLDRYASLQEYAQAKFRVFEEQKGTDTVIYNDEDALARKGVQKAKAKKVSFSVRKSKGVAVWCDRPDAHGTIFYGKEKYPLVKASLRGVHNVENMMASIVAAREAGCSIKTILKVLECFVGLPHRVQFVKKVNDVPYFDDSKATNVDAVVRALEGFDDGQVFLIAGGRDKEGSYEPLAKISRKKAKAVIVIGEAKDKIANALSGYTVVLKSDTLRDAVALAHQRATSGDVVLLSPACSSFDQFKDYKDRGDTFQRIVRSL